uniref:alkaline phosphatase, tissue-nonspecific isozyme-like n=1 Tax=Styela clava TaxID=7725 RepID=UPI001939DD71|nr:alkaline phosphatase, tissue-nonspecific isozyme-like [Styela clava]
MILRTTILAMLVFETCICLDPPHKELEKHPEYWMHEANTRLRESLKRLTPNTKPAKNVILIIGDGMDVATMTAGRIYKGQKYGTSGEEFQTTMDKFPYVGLSKVYTLNSQAPDSAGTGTALNTGVKTNSKMVGLSGQALHNNCSSRIGNEIKTILEYSADQGKSTGIVTSTHLTHATPASAYAHAPNRQWKTDADLTEEAKLNGCKDIGSQLIEHGRKINVLLGGGRAFMRPKGYKDEEYSDADDSLGGRNDSRNLIEEWIKLEGSDRARYVWDQKGFDNVDPTNVDHLLGLFEPGHMRFEHDRSNDLAGEPSLAEMTAKAIEILRKNRDGYFLLVEGGKIDIGHHSAKANIALSEFAALDDAVKLATRMTNPDETLIVVTADHGHMFTAGGYAVRGNPITGLADDHEKPLKALDDVAYTSIVYGTGKDWLGNRGNKRLNRSASESFQMDFEFPSAIPLKFETHSSTDVAVMARGPMSHLLSGIYEQNFIGYLMMYASCVGPDKRHCQSQRRFRTWDCSKYAKGSLFQKSSYNVRFSSISRQNKNMPWWCREVNEAEWTVVKPLSAPKTTFSPATRQSYEQDNSRPGQANLTTKSNLHQRSEWESQMWNRAQTTEAPRAKTPTPSGKFNPEETASKFHKRKNIQIGILNKRTRTNVRRRMTTATPRRIFRRELTTECENDTISISNGENNRPSSTLPTPNSLRSGRGNFLDRLAMVIRSQLEYRTITSSSSGMTKLDLSLMLDGETNSEKHEGI